MKQLLAKIDELKESINYLSCKMFNFFVKENTIKYFYLTSYFIYYLLLAKKLFQ